MPTSVAVPTGPATRWRSSSHPRPSYLAAVAEPSVARRRRRCRAHDANRKEPGEHPPSNQVEHRRGGESRQKPGKLIVVVRAKQRQGHRRQETIAKPGMGSDLFHDVTLAPLRSQASRHQDTRASGACPREQSAWVTPSTPPARPDAAIPARRHWRFADAGQERHRPPSTGCDCEEAAPPKGASPIPRGLAARSTTTALGKPQALHPARSETCQASGAAPRQTAGRAHRMHHAIAVSRTCCGIGRDRSRVRAPARAREHSVNIK